MLKYNILRHALQHSGKIMAVPRGQPIFDQLGNFASRKHNPGA